jgi:transposase InsO family protein
VSAFSFIAAERATHQVAVMCRCLGVSLSGYYAWSGRRPSRRARADAELLREISHVHAGSRGTYGAPRVHAELHWGVTTWGRKRVARLMRGAHLQGVPTRRRYRTTRQAGGVATAPDRLGRRFHTAERDRVWVADITYLRTGEGSCTWRRSGRSLVHMHGPVTESRLPLT